MRNCCTLQELNRSLPKTCSSHLKGASEMNEHDHALKSQMSRSCSNAAQNIAKAHQLIRKDSSDSGQKKEQTGILHISSSGYSGKPFVSVMSPSIHSVLKELLNPMGQSHSSNDDQNKDNKDERDSNDNHKEKG